MNKDLVTRIQLAYPEGTIYFLDEAALISEERDERIMGVLRTVAEVCSLHFTFDLFNKPAHKISLTQKNHPSFEEWINHMPNPDRLAWINANLGKPYPVFWLKISRVADYYKYFYNYWVPRTDTGYLVPVTDREPDEQWKIYETIICDELASKGFYHFTRELSREITSLVLEYEQMPDDDPRWDDDSYERPLVPSTLHRCFFGN